MEDFTNTSMEELAAIIAAQLKLNNIQVVLVGGLAVSLYTDNRYLTKDIDMVDISYQKPVTMQTAMAILGFYKQGRIYCNDTTDITVEFPAAPLSVGDEVITKQTTASTPFGDIPILYATDIVKDRLTAYFHWQDQQALVQALCVMLCHAIKPETMNTFCVKEASEHYYKRISDLYRTLKANSIVDMIEIEKVVIAENIKQL
jgi:hypothetical protein